MGSIVQVWQFPEGPNVACRPEFGTYDLRHLSATDLLGSTLSPSRLRIDCSPMFRMVICPFCCRSPNADLRTSSVLWSLGNRCCPLGRGRRATRACLQSARSPSNHRSAVGHRRLFTCCFVVSALCTRTGRGDRQWAGSAVCREERTDGQRLRAVCCSQ